MYKRNETGLFISAITKPDMLYLGPFKVANLKGVQKGRERIWMRLLIRWWGVNTAVVTKN